MQAVPDSAQQDAQGAVLAPAAAGQPQRQREQQRDTGGGRGLAGVAARDRDPVADREVMLAAERAGLKISSKLFSLAKIVTDDQRRPR